MRGVSKSFPGVRALCDIDIDVRRGEVLAIVGENGAGKSTLINVLGGAHQPDSGTIQIDGRNVSLGSPAVAQAAGVAVIYQEFNLVSQLTVRENIFLGRAMQAWGIVDVKSERQAARRLFDKLGIDINLDAKVSTLSIAQCQVLEIAKALSTDVRILVMDEPTATLTPSEVSKLFETVNELRANGIGIIYVSHRLNEVLEIADRVVVLRDGQHVGERSIEKTSRQMMIEMMVGREIENEFPKERHPAGPIRLRAKNLSWHNKVKNVCLEARSGEVLGITGLVGAGRTELAQMIAGAIVPDSGNIWLDNQRVQFQSPKEAIHAGICLLTEDRKGQGLVLNHSVQENFGLPNLDQFGSHGILNLENESAALSEFVNGLKIKIVSGQLPAGNLSGGNQQKLVLAKWLQRNCDVVIFDEPTRGIDVGAKYEIYLLINKLAAEGKAIIMISSEIPEVLGMSDRVLVMRQGMVAGELKEPGLASQKQVMEMAAN